MRIHFFLLLLDGGVEGVGKVFKSVLSSNNVVKQFKVTSFPYITTDNTRQNSNNFTKYRTYFKTHDPNLTF